MSAADSAVASTHSDALEFPVRSRSVVLRETNIDTDQIIPARFLSTTSRKGLGRHAFNDWRWLDDGTPNPAFAFNRDENAGRSILIAGRNFGCGSSREHAPVAIGASGCRAVVAESYARIFFRNCVATGEVYPYESEARLSSEFKTGDEAEINTEENTIKRVSDGKIFKLKDIGAVGPVVEAGGMFKYARKIGIIRDK